jgi:negative regulator of sigma-B (phosphoserine phosphatase)
MTEVARDGAAVVAWGCAGSGLEIESGDIHVVEVFPGGALVALVDALGHGPEAAEVARAAAAVLAAHPADPVTDLVRRCHAALRNTRGAVMSVASFHVADSAMTWLAVGNVDGVLVHCDGSTAKGIVGRGGVVGYRIPALCGTTLDVSAGDTLIMATDGIRSDFCTDLAIDQDPQQLADDLLARFASGLDDAHVVVARYLGGQP